jgi:hypothetical protein
MIATFLSYFRASTWVHVVSVTNEPPISWRGLLSLGGIIVASVKDNLFTELLFVNMMQMLIAGAQTVREALAQVKTLELIVQTPTEVSRSFAQ